MKTWKIKGRLNGRTFKMQVDAATLHLAVTKAMQEQPHLLIYKAKAI